MNHIIQNRTHLSPPDLMVHSWENSRQAYQQDLAGNKVVLYLVFMISSSLSAESEHITSSLKTCSVLSSFDTQIWKTYPQHLLLKWRKKMSMVKYLTELIKNFSKFENCWWWQNWATSSKQLQLYLGPCEQLCKHNNQTFHLHSEALSWLKPLNISRRMYSMHRTKINLELTLLSSQIFRNSDLNWKSKQDILIN